MENCHLWPSWKEMTMSIRNVEGDILFLNLIFAQGFEQCTQRCALEKKFRICFRVWSTNTKTVHRYLRNLSQKIFHNFETETIL